MRTERNITVLIEPGSEGPKAAYGVLPISPLISLSPTTTPPSTDCSSSLVDMAADLAANYSFPQPRLDIGMIRIRYLEAMTYRPFPRGRKLCCYRDECIMVYVSTKMGIDKQMKSAGYDCEEKLRR